MYGIYIGPRYILQGEYTFKVYIRDISISYRELKEIPLKRVSRCLKTVTNPSAKYQILTFLCRFQFYKEAI